MLSRLVFEVEDKLALTLGPRSVRKHHLHSHRVVGLHVGDGHETFERCRCLQSPNSYLRRAPREVRGEQRNVGTETERNCVGSTGIRCALCDARNQQFGLPDEEGASICPSEAHVGLRSASNDWLRRRIDCLHGTARLMHTHACCGCSEGLAGDFNLVINGHLILTESRIRHDKRKVVEAVTQEISDDIQVQLTGLRSSPHALDTKADIVADGVSGRWSI